MHLPEPSRKLAAAMICAGCLGLNAAQADESPKYVFLMIGDGMASPQVHAAEAYLAALAAPDEVPGSAKSVILHMNQMPHQGMQMSYANNRFITDSAAAGTALACGHKTDVGVISMDPNAEISYVTLAERAKEKGMKVGILSSVSIDHATPAVFYSHQPSRNNYEEIGSELLNSGFDYFAGGGFRVNKYKSDRYAALSNADRYATVEQLAGEQGFVFANTRAEFDALQPGVRAIAVNPYLDSSNAIPYALNRKAGNFPGGPYDGTISLADFTRKGVALLDNPNGFFMMVEGGKIDWAGHANDARANIEDTIAFDDAIGVALEFAAAHPDETLIVVTGDHECGGMTLGFAGTAYDTYFEVLVGQKLAYDDFDRLVFAPYLAEYETPPADIDRHLWDIVFYYFGLDGAGLTADEDDDLTEYEVSLLEDAFDKAAGGESVKTEQEDQLLYDYYNPFSVTLTHLLNRKAGLDWTSYSHTAVPVPVMASGVQSGLFDGYYENTDVARKIAAAMQVTLTP